MASLLVSARVAGETLAISVPTIVEGFLGTGDIEAHNARLAGWARKVVAHARIRLEVRGQVPVGRTFVVMSNHQSHFDVPVLYHALGANLRMVAKRELFLIPIFGRALRDSGFVEIDRKNRAAAIASLARAKDALARGINIWIAPEGTRSKTGALASFKKGGFVIAQETGCAILPVSVQGTHDILPPSALRTKKGVSVRVTVHAPIASAALPGEDEGATRERLIREVRQAITSGLEAS